MSLVLIWSLVFIASLAGLIKASDYFIDSAEKIGLSLGLPSFVIGVTLVATGTSLPELISSIIAVSRDSSEIVVGNVIGSNITNVCFVLGLIGVWSRSFKVDFDIQRVDMPFLIGTSFLMGMTLIDSQFTMMEALISLSALVVYIVYITRIEHPEETEEEKTKRPKLNAGVFLTLVVSSAGIYFGARYNVLAIIKLSELLGVGKEVIALTAVALGTSLPELVVSIVAVKRGNHELVVGNVLGSNIFNSLAVMGIPALFGTLVIPATIVTFSLPMMIACTLLYFFVTIDKEVNRWEGILLLLFYFLFITSILRTAIA